MKKKGVIIVAGGAGTRMGTEIPKQFLTLAGKPVLAHTVEVFRTNLPEADIIAAIPSPYIDTWCEMCLQYAVPYHKICEGGATRFESVANAIRELDHDCAYIAVHDGVRPLVSRTLIAEVFATAEKHGTAIPAINVTDTIRKIVNNSSHPVDRTALRAVQTPQAFRADILRAGYERAKDRNFTDDASVVESIGYSLMLCGGERTNIKITSPEDLLMVEAVLKNGRPRL